MANITKGDALMLFDENKKSLALATNHVLNIASQTVDVNCKDFGIYGASDISKITWDITSDNLYSVGTFDTLVEKQLSRTPVSCYFGFADGWDGSALEDDNWELDENNSYFWGEAIISSISLNAASGDNATSSISLQGSGPLHHYTYTA